MPGYIRLLGAAMLLAGAAAAQNDSAREWSFLIGRQIMVERDVTYKTTGGVATKLDFYIPYNKKPGPTLLYIHGGGWTGGTKEQYVLWFLPYLRLGMRVVSVQYRLGGVAPAPAAAYDCRCALKWVVAHGAKYGVDPDRITVTGGSAGGHLALLTTFTRPGDGLDVECPGGPEPRVKGVINYYGFTDLVSLREQSDKYVKNWFRDAPRQEELARLLSPMQYVRAGLPPVLSIHGDADKSVPFEQAERMHKRLEELAVPNRLVRIPGGEHGWYKWGDAPALRVQREVEEFLKRHRLVD